MRSPDQAGEVRILTITVGSRTIHFLRFSLYAARFFLSLLDLFGPFTITLAKGRFIHSGDESLLRPVLASSYTRDAVYPLT